MNPEPNLYTHLKNFYLEFVAKYHRRQTTYPIIKLTRMNTIVQVAILRITIARQNYVPLESAAASKKIQQEKDESVMS